MRRGRLDGAGQPQLHVAPLSLEQEEDRLPQDRVEHVPLGEQAADDRVEELLARRPDVEPAGLQHHLDPLEVLAGRVGAEVVDEAVGEKAADAVEAPDRPPALVVGVAGDLAARVPDERHLRAQLEHLAVLAVGRLEECRIVRPDGLFDGGDDAFAVAAEQGVDLVDHVEGRLPRRIRDAERGETPVAGGWSRFRRTIVNVPAHGKPPRLPRSPLRGRVYAVRN